MTELPKRMTEDLRLRNYSDSTLTPNTVANFVRYFHKSPDKMGPEEIGQYQFVPVGREKARLINVRAENCSIEVLLHAHTQRALVRAGCCQAQGAAALADRAEP